MDRFDATLSRRRLLQSTGAAALASSVSGLAMNESRGAPEEGVPDNPIRSDRKIRVGVVGGGFGASFHWHEHPNVTVLAVSDLRADRRQRLMITYQCDRSYDSLEKLILDQSIEAVAVFTGAPDHVRHSVAAMNAGKHVICAVPAAMNLDECAQLLETKKRTERTYMMAETSYYRDHTITARQLFNKGGFGELLYIEGEYYHPLVGEYRDAYWWREGKPTWRHGYAPMLYPTHSTGFMVGVTRERATVVSCLGWGDSNDPDLQKNQYRNPYSAQMALMKTNKHHVWRCNVIFSGTAHGERAQWFGTKLTYYMPGSGQPFSILGKDAPKWDDVPKYRHLLPKPMRHDSGHGGSHVFLTHEFVAALVEEREPAIDIYESLAMNVPGIIAHQSALKGGEQLKVPSFDPMARAIGAAAG